MLVVLVSCAGCAGSGARPSAEKPVPPVATTETECLSLGGTWGLHGATEVAGPFCASPTADGGKACSDSLECQGRCLADSSSSPGAQARGKCAASYYPGACFAAVEGNRVQSRICN